MKKLKNLLFFKKEDGLFTDFIKISFWAFTLIYCYISLCTIVSLLTPPAHQLPSSVNSETIWLYYTIAYLIIFTVHMFILKVVRRIKKK